MLFKFLDGAFKGAILLNKLLNSLVDVCDNWEEKLLELFCAGWVGGGCGLSGRKRQHWSGSGVGSIGASLIDVVEKRIFRIILRLLWLKLADRCW